MATLPGQPGVRHLFRSHLADNSANNTCLTCRDEQQFSAETSTGILSPCDYSENIISPGFDAYVQVGRYHNSNSLIRIFPPQHCLGPGIPSTHVFSLPGNTLIWTMDTNTRIQQQVHNTPTTLQHWQLCFSISG